MFGTCVQKARAVTRQAVSSSDDQADRWVTLFQTTGDLFKSGHAVCS